MKIDGIYTGQAIEKSGAAQTKESKSASSGNDFAGLLAGEIDSAGKSGALESGVGGPESVAGLMGAQALALNPAQSSGTSEAVSSLTSMLDGLDSLQNALQGGSSPKQIDSLIKQVNQQASGLDAATSALPADSNLRGLAEEAKVTAYMESVKWRRGDYL
ncbi:MAG: flagellar assembly protein FliX [Syntrophobacteraceae bacterium]